MKLTYEDKVLIYELRKEEMIDKILHEYCSQDRVSLEYSLPNQGMLPNWLAQYKKKLEEMTESERLQAENAVLKKNERTPNRGFWVNHKRIQRLMKALGLSARIRRKRKYYSYQGEVGMKAENLIQRQFEASKPMEKCYTDVTVFAIPASSQNSIYHQF